MAHDELLAKIDKLKENASGDVWLIHNDRCCGNCTCKEVEEEVTSIHNTLRVVVELHKPFEVNGIVLCDNEPLVYPCPTIQAIEKELK